MATTTTASKRARTPSLSSTSPQSKVVRTSDEDTTSHPLLCTLPPTCTRHPTPLASSADLEVHYAKYHAHVCESPGCGCVFPDARLLELHQTECHDPIALVRKDRGEKIFACHLETCPRFFSTPKNRRLHLIQTHGYPKEYFFAVTNKGIGGLLRRWGDGASMIRGQWKPRSPRDSLPTGGDDTEMSMDSESQHSDHVELAAQVVDDVDVLADSMTSLSIVPQNIRFGRGGKNAGFAAASQEWPPRKNRRGGRAAESSTPRVPGSDVEAVSDSVSGASMDDEAQTPRPFHRMLPQDQTSSGNISPKENTSNPKNSSTKHPSRGRSFGARGSTRGGFRGRGGGRRKAEQS
ncbi:hypothetical protein FISHEDRAFT_66492 [Fistulina hepatica ATCC 64428]|uniref:C2H2-type domain-containing protein n=1 Tax=Fistulina hepatica ATCC 64428 TaxID=1128425 RepID=A0A0D7A5Q5_9AGAR|nr:hypothetical protein FISHEDRAFT_66492 [Fistulina hepatica ATCC 64428]